MAVHRKVSCRFILRAGLAMAAAVPAFSLAYAQESAASPRKTARGEGSWRLSIGANYSRGDYGETIDTKVASFPIALRYSKDRFRIRVSVPYVVLSGPGSLLDRGDGGGVDVGDDDLRAERHQGIGDVSIQAGYLFPLGDGFALDATGRVKLPTASRAKRLGTGKVDVTAGLELVKNLKGASLYIGGRRRFVGEPDGANLRDVWSVGAGGNVRAAKGLSLGLDYSWRQSSRIGGGDISEVSGWTNISLNRRLRLTIYGGTGLTQNSSDLIAGTSLSYRFQAEQQTRFRVKQGLAAYAVTPPLRIQRVIVEFRADAPRAADIEVTNNGEGRSYVVVEPRQLLHPGMPNEERVATPDPAKIGLLASPAHFILEPGQHRTLRIAAVKTPAGEERVYRVTVKPVIGDVAGSQSGLKLLVGYDLLVLVRPPIVRDSVRSDRSGSKLTITNNGNASVELAEGKQCDAAGKDCQALSAKRLYAGASWTQQLPLPTNGEQRVRSAGGWSTLKF